MAFDGHPGRIRALERQLVGNAATVAVLTSSMTVEEIAAGERLIAEAKARGRECIVVRIRFPAPPPDTEAKGHG